MDAMRYSSLGGGKRLRPFLVVESSAVFGVPREAALLAGAALECIHCYSLIHDDLPAMDNSDLRRGRPTLHKKTDDATAILAGRRAADAGRRHRHPRRDPLRIPTVRLMLTRALARASGIGGNGRRPECSISPAKAGSATANRSTSHAAADEDRRAAALRLHRRRHPRPVLARNIRLSTITAARSAKPSDRRRPARRRGRRARSASRPDRSGRWARPLSSPSSGSTAPSSACRDLVARAPETRFRSSAPRALLRAAGIAPSART
jgi:hypothetical protein